MSGHRAWIIEATLLLVIVAVAAALRLYRLDAFPPGLFYDEAQNGVDAERVLAGAHPIYFLANNGREPLFIYLTALSVKVFGPTLLGVRVPAVIVGLAMVLALYALGRLLRGRRFGLVAAFLLAVSYWPVSLSRLGFRAGLLPLFETLTVCFLILTIRRRRWWLAALSGLFLGGSLYTYISARIFPAVVVVVAVLLVADSMRGSASGRFRVPGDLVRQLALAAGVAVLVMSPLAAYAVRHPDVVFARLEQASLGATPQTKDGDGAAKSTETGSQAKKVRQPGPVAALARNILVNVGMFGFEGDAQTRHNYPGRPVFGQAVFLLFAYAVFLGLRGREGAAGVSLLAWLGIMLVPGILSGEAPHFLRTVGAMPPAFLLAALGIQRAFEEVRRRRRLATVGAAALAVVLSAEAASTAWDYFVRLPQRAEFGAAFDRDTWATVQDARARLDSGQHVVFEVARLHPTYVYVLGRPEAVEDVLLRKTGGMEFPDTPPVRVTFTSLGRAAPQTVAGAARLGVPVAFTSPYRELADLLPPRRSTATVAPPVIGAYPLTVPPGLTARDRSLRLSLPGGLELTAYDVRRLDAGRFLDAPFRIAHGTPADLWVYWQIREPTRTSYTAVIEVRDSAGRRLSYQVAPLAGPEWLAPLWRPGEMYYTQSRIVPATGLPMGEYRVTVAIAGCCLAELPFWKPCFADLPLCKPGNAPTVQTVFEFAVVP